jgi:hypothetical protein
VDQTRDAQHGIVIGQQADHNHTRLSNSSAEVHASSDKSEGKANFQVCTVEYMQVPSGSLANQ